MPAGRNSCASGLLLLPALLVVLLLLVLLLLLLLLMLLLVLGESAAQRFVDQSRLRSSSTRLLSRAIPNPLGRDLLLHHHSPLPSSLLPRPSTADSPSRTGSHRQSLDITRASPPLLLLTSPLASVLSFPSPSALPNAHPTLAHHHYDQARPSTICVRRPP